MAKSCQKEGCNNPRFSKGFCQWHKYLSKDYSVKKPAKKRINAISEKMKEQLKEYRIVRDIFMKENPCCEICSKPSQDLHHKSGRGKNLCKVDTFMAVCRGCHNFIHNNPKKSRELLYLL